MGIQCSVCYHCYNIMKIGKTLDIDVTENIQINRNTSLTMYEAARWSLLIRGIETIDKKARDLKIDLEKDKNWIKPLALQKYIDAATPAMVTEIKALQEQGDDNCII